ncbi:CsgG/HfaB family protein [Halarcobacter sp.]|uniref:CsgG/HfaB family protein n=1 Tax=Halarcobacter sp. TaxID=2321133 RepID=UPI002AAB8FB3|nr:CsgG/HfaB family protein [Halarcobacter sp.]
MKRLSKLTASLSLAILTTGAFTGCVSGMTQSGAADAKTAGTGSAGGANSQGANKGLERCVAPIGTVSFHEDRNDTWYQYLTRDLRLPSTIPVLRLLTQQSNCFVIVERGKGMNDLMRERQLMQSGELRGNSKFHKGQMVAADYTIIPSITFSEQGTGGLGAIAGGLFGSVAGAVAGGFKTSDASTMLTLIDNRSSVQLAAAEGSARTTDWNILGGLFGGRGGGGLGAYTKTPEGKTIVSAFMDSMNGLIRSVKAYKAQEVSGGLGAGGNLGVQGGNTQYGLEGVLTKRVYNSSRQEFDYEIINKERTQKWTFSSRKKILYKNDLIRFNLINGTPEVSSFIKLESRYKQKYWN